jgi:hypothetical protein
MKRKIVSIVTTAIVSAMMVVPALAASPSTTTVMSTPVTIPAADLTAKGYQVTPAEVAATATTPAQSIALAAGVTADVGDVQLPNGVVFASIPAQPASIATAKMDIMKNTDLQKSLAQCGVGTKGQTAVIKGAGQLGFSNGAKGVFKVGLTAEGITSAKNVAILVYVPGETAPRVIKPKFKNGKLEANLPVPCEYNIVTNEAPAPAASAANVPAGIPSATAPKTAQITLSTNNVR